MFSTQLYIDTDSWAGANLSWLLLKEMKPHFLLEKNPFKKGKTPSSTCFKRSWMQYILLPLSTVMMFHINYSLNLCLAYHRERSGEMHNAPSLILTLLCQPYSHAVHTHMHTAEDSSTGLVLFHHLQLISDTCTTPRSSCWHILSNLFLKWQ